jgi:hypothetical protein
MSPEEQVRWAMAAGPGLNVVLPAVDATGMLEYPGYTVRSRVSPGGEYFATTYYVYIEDENCQTQFRLGHLLYDGRTGEPLSSALPPDAEGIAFGPGGELAYVRDEGSQVCVADTVGSEPSCFGQDAYYGWPHWSPDGEWLLFPAEQAGAGDELDLFKARPSGDELT